MKSVFDEPFADIQREMVKTKILSDRAVEVCMQITIAISLCADCDEYITAACIRHAVVASVASGLTKQELLTAMSKVYDDLTSREQMKQANAPSSRSMQ